MADEKLPDYVEEAFMRCDYCFGSLESPCETCHNLRIAIHRYASEREAVALEKVTQMLDALAVHESDNGLADSLPDDCAEKVRALIHKAPTNG